MNNFSKSQQQKAKNYSGFKIYTKTSQNSVSEESKESNKLEGEIERPNTVQRTNVMK